MAIPVSLSALPQKFSASFLPYQISLRQRQRAKAFSKGKYLHELRIRRAAEGHFNINALCYRSQRKNESPHKIDIDLDDHRILDASCSCKAGVVGKCAHVLATIMTVEDWMLEGFVEVPAEQSSTRLRQEWGKPRGTKIAPEPVSRMVISKPGNAERKRKPMTTKFVDNRKIRVTQSDLDYLSSLNDSPISYLVQGTHSTTIPTPLGPQLVGSLLSYHAPLMSAIPQQQEGSSGCGNISFPQPPHVLIPAMASMEAKWESVKVTQEEAEAIEN